MAYQELVENSKKDIRSISWWIQSFFLIVLIAFIVFGIINYYSGFNNAIDWLLATNTTPLSSVFDEFNVGLFRFQIPADNYLTWQSFSPTRISIDYRYFYVFLVVLAIGFSILQTAASRMTRYAFVFVNLVFILLYSQLHLEETVIFGAKDRIYVFVLTGFHLLIGFLFNSFIKNTNLFIRFITFLVLHALTAIIIWQYAQVKDPFLAITPYAFIPGAILSIVFIVMVSQEVVFSILFVTTRTSIEGRGNGKHFLILSTIYIINLGLLVARNIGIFQERIALIDEFWTLILSTLVAVWSIRYKAYLFPGYPMKNYAYYLLIGLGIVCFTFLAVQFAIINTPVTDAFKDIISYVHLGFGFMFFCYVILNFLGALYQNVTVYKIVYQEINFPYVTSLLGGLAVIAGLYFYTGKVAFFESKGGYYNIHGDVQSYLSNYSLAEKYYEAGGIYGGQNHKSHYNLATFAQFDKDNEQTEYFLNKAVKGDRSEFAYVALADFHQKNGDFLKSYLTLREALEKNPRSTVIKNNLAIQFTKTNILDSALLYFNPNNYEDKWKDVASTNTWYVYAKSNQLFGADTIQQILNTTRGPISSNLVAYSNLNNQALDLSTIDIPNDSSLNSLSFPLINNASLNNGENSNNRILEVVQKASNHHTNTDLKHLLDYDKALIAYKKHDYNSFFRNMDLAQVGSNNEEKGKFLNILGMVALKLNAPKVAASFFKSAIEYRFNEAKVNYGLALSESNQIPEAITYWQSILNNESDSSHYQIAFNQLNILTIRNDEAISIGNPSILYQYLRANRNRLTYNQFYQLLNGLDNDNMKADLLIIKIKDQFKSGKSSNLLAMKEALDNLNINPGQLTKDRINVGITLALLNEDIEDARNLGKSLNSQQALEWPFLIIGENISDSTTLNSLYQEMGFNNPFNIVNTMMAVNYFKEAGNEELAYNILVNAIEINPNSLPLLKEYAFTCLEQSLSEFGIDVLPRIQSIANTTDYKEFEKEFFRIKAVYEAKDIWE